MGLANLYDFKEHQHERSVDKIIIYLSLVSRKVLPEVFCE